MLINSIYKVLITQMTKLLHSQGNYFLQVCEATFSFSGTLHVLAAHMTPLETFLIVDN